MVSKNFYPQFEKYNEALNLIGLGRDMIDFSDVSDENTIKICEFIKKLAVIEKLKGKDGRR